MANPHQEVDQFISSLTPGNKKIVERLRGIIFAAIPEVVEEIKWGHPVYTLHGLLCYISPAQEYVSCGFFNGVELNDPNGFLKGSGNKLRHIKIKSLAEIQENQLTLWIMQTAEFNTRD